MVCRKILNLVSVRTEAPRQKLVCLAPKLENYIQVEKFVKVMNLKKKNGKFRILSP